MFTFDGVNIRTVVDKVSTISRPVLPPREHILIDIPGMAGAILGQKKTGVKAIVVTVHIFGDTKAQIRQKVDKLADLLMTENVAPLVFDDEPNKTYYAIVADETPFDELSVLGTAEITFLCPDPYAKGAAKTSTLTAGGSKAVVNTGNAPALPKFTATFTKAATYCQFGLSGETAKIKIVYAFKIGDVLIIDHEQNLITINGTVNNQTITLDSDFFTLPAGSKSIWNTMSDATAATVKVDFVERWL